MSAHKLVKHGRASAGDGPGKVWGECSCGLWCWLGTYHMPKGRLATLRAEHAKHVAYEENARVRDSQLTSTFNWNSRDGVTFDAGRGISTPTPEDIARGEGLAREQGWS